MAKSLLILGNMGRSVSRYYSDLGVDLDLGDVNEFRKVN
tara:strand:+ start:295 stop:411 length:117 start_codon:yes stop_codon:yes gene_type:complete